jgi:hypothetical protein
MPNLDFPTSEPIDSNFNNGLVAPTFFLDGGGE